MAGVPAGIRTGHLSNKSDRLSQVDRCSMLTQSVTLSVLGLGIVQIKKNVES